MQYVIFKYSAFQKTCAIAVRVIRYSKIRQIVPINKDPQILCFKGSVTILQSVKEKNHR